MQSTFTQTTHAPPSLAVCGSHGGVGRSFISRSGQSPRVTFMPVPDLTIGTWGNHWGQVEDEEDEGYDNAATSATADDDDSSIGAALGSSQNNVSRTMDSLPPRNACLTSDSLLSPNDELQQLSARSEPNFRRSALRFPSSPEAHHPLHRDDFEIMSNPAAALGLGPRPTPTHIDDDDDDEYEDSNDPFYRLNSSGSSLGRSHGMNANLFSSGGSNGGFGVTPLQLPAPAFGSPTASFSAHNRISPRNPGTSSRILFGNNGFNASRSSLDLGASSSSTIGSGFGSVASGAQSSVGGYSSASHSSNNGSTPSPSWARNRPRDGPGSGSSSSSVTSNGTRSLNNSVAAISISRPPSGLYASAGARLHSQSTGSNGGDSQLGGLSSSSLLSTSVSSSDGYASLNDSSTRTSLDQGDDSSMSGIDFNYQASPQYQHGARTLPSASDFSFMFGSPSRLSMDTSRANSPSPIASFQLPTSPSPNHLNTPSTSGGRSRSRTFGADGASSSNMGSPASPLAPTYSASSHNLMPSPSRGSLVPEKSPTRRGGGPAARFAARTQSFISNPHPTSRHRRESSSSSLSRPRPRPNMQSTGSDIEIPKSMMTGPSGGLIPDLSSVRANNIPPPSPSRPQSKLPHSIDGNGTINRIKPETVRHNLLLIYFSFS